MPRYDYACARGHVCETYAGREDDSLPCVACGSPAHRVTLAAPRINGNAHPPMAERRMRLDNWMNALEESQTAHRKAGTEPPDVLGIAKRQAALIRQHTPEVITGT